MKISFGSAASLAVINKVEDISWEVFADALSRPWKTDDKASHGWYIPAEFDPVYRDSENFVARHAITFDFDHVSKADGGLPFLHWGELDFAFYTTHSHMKVCKAKPEDCQYTGTAHPRFRVVMPLSRPTGYDEFQAVARKLAEKIGIELIARESFVPSQMMFVPCIVPGAPFVFKLNKGQPVDVDAVLAEYKDWTDVTQWPHRKEQDGVHAIGAGLTAPDEKPGVVGDFCRAFRVAEAIKRFELPYVPTETSGRWTYTHGSRPEGAIEYDDGLKFHSHHDTDPARGQNNAFDLVRLHRYGDLDSAEDRRKPVAERPSYLAMASLIRDLPEVTRTGLANKDADFTEDLGPLAPSEATPTAAAFAQRLDHVLNTPTVPDWLIEDVIERGVIGILAGPRGSYKSFIALDWAMRIALTGAPVYVVSAEGGDFDRRASAWLKVHGDGKKPGDIELYVAERRLDLSTKEGVELIRQDCARLGIRPALFVLDTFSKLSGGLEENDNSEVKQFIGRLDNGLKRASSGFGATVLLVAHTGHSDATRTRGASALAADTDAEYIASRNEGHGAGTVSISRSRFKSSPELPPLCYAPKVVELDRADKSGRPITSLIMEPAEAPPPRGAKKGATTANQKLVMQTYQLMAPAGESISREDLVEGARLKLTKPEGRDTRAQHAARAIDQLVANGILYAHAGDRVGISTAVAATEDWV